MSFYQTWSIAPTKDRPHPNALGETDWSSAVDWTALLQSSIETLPNIISASTSQAQQAGASPGEVSALQAQIAAALSDRKKLAEKAQKQQEQERAIKTRNLLILSGIGVVGILGAILILK